MRTRCHVLLSAMLAAIAPAPSMTGAEAVLVPGDPPLTEEMVDDYAAFLAWRSGPSLVRFGGAEQFREMIINEWKNADGRRRAEFLAELKWWRENSRVLDEPGRGPSASRFDPNVERARQSARDAEAIHLLMLQQWNDARQREIQTISNLQAKHHETMMQIIQNIRPTGRYEYNPATGRYDRYVP